MSELSSSIKGNFDGLAEALNENLMTVLEELRNILKETNGIIDNKSNNSSSTKNIQYQQPIQPSNTQVQQENNKKTDITPVIEKLESLLQQFKSGVPVYNKIG